MEPNFYDYVVYFDGGCYPNPGGEATWAYIIKNCTGCIVGSDNGSFSGRTSNNVAECVAARNALSAMRQFAISGQRIALVGDSRICLNKIATRQPGKGLFAESLKQAQAVYAAMVHAGVKMCVKWVPREENAECDALTQAARTRLTKPSKRRRVAKVKLPEPEYMI